MIEKRIRVRTAPQPAAFLPFYRRTRTPEGGAAPAPPLPALAGDDNRKLMALPSVIDEIDRLFEELVRRPWGSVARQVVPVEMREVEDGWMVKLPVEGLTPTDLQVHVQGNQLTISGHRRRAEERRGKTGWTQTQREVTFQRAVALPAGADPENIDARIENSTLCIHIRRRQP
jgi:HSP20 family protein